MHVHCFHRIRERLILVLVDQRRPFGVVHMNHRRTTARHGHWCGEVHDDLRPTLENIDYQSVALRVAVIGGDQVTAPASLEVRDSRQPQFTHKAAPPKVPVENRVQGAVKRHTRGSIRPPRDRKVNGGEKSRRRPCQSDCQQREQ